MKRATHFNGFIHFVTPNGTSTQINRPYCLGTAVCRSDGGPLLDCSLWSSDTDEPVTCKRCLRYIRLHAEHYLRGCMFGELELLRMMRSLRELNRLEGFQPHHESHWTGVENLHRHGFADVVGLSWCPGRCDNPVHATHPVKVLGYKITGTGIRLLQLLESKEVAPWTTTTR